MTDQPTLFETPRERDSREYNERLAEYMAVRQVAGGYQCQECGGISPNQSRYWADHGLMGTRCVMAERFARNHTLYDLRAGDRERYMASTARLRAIASGKASLRA